MSAHNHRRGTHLPTAPRQATARLRRLAAALAAFTCALLAPTAIAPGRLDDERGPGRWRSTRRARPGVGRWHGGLADHLDRARRCPGRSNRGPCSWTARWRSAGPPPRPPHNQRLDAGGSHIRSRLPSWATTGVVGAFVVGAGGYVGAVLDVQPEPGILALCLGDSRYPCVVQPHTTGLVAGRGRASSACAQAPVRQCQGRPG